jgi:hypothetical protein
MIRKGPIVVVAVLVVMLAVPAHAQTTAPAPAAPPAVRQIDRNDLRRQIYVMEGALTRAVSFGAQQLNREIRSVMPEMIALSGEPQARGVYLDGYGVFFDVGVPILHQSMVWSFRQMLGQDVKGVAEALNVLKQNAKEVNSARRTAIENAIARLELQIGPLADATGSDLGLQTLRPNTPALGVGAASLLGNESSRPPAPTGGGTPSATADANVLEGQTQAQAVPQTIDKKKYMQDPNAINRAYTDAVQRELIEAMLDYSVPMAIAPDEFLTVGARDNMQRDSLAPPDPHEEVVTILLRIKGSDLAAFRAGQIDRAEARKRVQVREF